MASLIGIYDSGLGGLSVMHAVRALLPDYNILYLADTAFCPYGPRPLEEVQARVLACTTWLVQQDAAMVVIACNTASSAALEIVREQLPVPVVGMEPGVKPAVAATRTRQIGILATSGTLGGRRFTSLLQRFASDVEVRTIPCHLLVTQVEKGDLAGPETRFALQHCLDSLTSKKVDTIVLGCTHFNFIAPLLTELAGPNVTIINTASAVAKQVERVVQSMGLCAGQGTVHFVTTGDPSLVAAPLSVLWGSTHLLAHGDI